MSPIPCLGRLGCICPDMSTTPPIGSPRPEEAREGLCFVNCMVFVGHIRYPMPRLLFFLFTFNFEIILNLQKGCPQSTNNSNIPPCPPICAPTPFPSSLPPYLSLSPQPLSLNWTFLNHSRVNWRHCVSLLLNTTVYFLKDLF